MASSGNFCTLNRLPYSTRFRSNLGKGNLYSNPGNNCMGFGTMALTTGKKWYMEGIAQNAYNTTMGIFELNDANVIQNNLDTFYYNNTSYKSAFYHRDGTKYVDGANSSYGATFAINDVIGMAVDLESATNTITFYKNNSSQGSFNLGTNGLDYLFCMARGTSGGGWYMNFGQDSTFGGNKTAGGNADDNGFGDFFYSVPSGHLAVCSGNLGIDSDIDPAQTDDNFPQKQCGVVTYTGTGSSNAITGLGFRPDLVIIKNRPGTQGTKVTDSSRGVTKVLQTATSSAESTDSNGLTAFGSDGFTVGSDAGYNGSGNGMVAWCWRANGGTTASNSDGSITSTVQANTKAGFSIVQYTGVNSATTATVGHGLGKAPTFIIHKVLNATGWHFVRGVPGMTNASTVRDLNPNGSPTDVSGSGGALVAPTSTTFNINNYTGIGGGGYNYVAYCWAPIEGYSAFGTYTGNANADGPFIYTGFRPRIILIIGQAYGIENVIWDTERSTFNVMDDYLRWGRSSAEGSSSSFAIDALSNGFKLRTSGGDLNTSGATQIYACWGDVPFKYNNTF